MTTKADQLFFEIANDMASAFDRAGEQIEAAVKDDLSVPVEIKTGPRGGKIIVRSKPGEHPRKETGKLQAGVTHSVIRDGVNCTLIVNDPVNYAGFLDPGLNRPIVTGLDERWTDAVEDSAANAVEGHGAA